MRRDVGHLFAIHTNKSECLKGNVESKKNKEKK